MKRAVSDKFSIKVGRLVVEGEKVKPLPDKGELQFYMLEGLCCFMWRSLDGKIETDPIVVFQNDWEWKKVQTGKGRVYNLKCNSEENQNLFWMQYTSNNNEDNLYSSIINGIIKSGKVEVEENDGEPLITNEEEEKKQRGELPATSSQNTNTNANTNTNTGNKGGLSSQAQAQGAKNAFKYLEDFAKQVRGSKHENAGLTQVLNANNILKHLDDKDIEELLKFLPEGQQTVEGFKENIRCPQFYQALSTFNDALGTQNLYGILQNFGLEVGASESAFKGIELFLKAVIKKYPKKKDEPEKK